MMGMCWTQCARSMLSIDQRFGQTAIHHNAPDTTFCPAPSPAHPVHDHHPPGPAAALGAVKVLQWVEAATLLAEALGDTVTHDAADLQAIMTSHSTAQHDTEPVGTRFTNC